MRRFFNRLNNFSPSPTNSQQFVGTSPRNVFASEEEYNGDQYDTPFDFWNPEFASDPAEWERSFKMELDELKRALTRPVKDFKDVKQVCKNLEAMCKLLAMEVNALPVASIGPLLELIFAHDIFESVISWAKRIPDLFVPMCQVSLFHFYSF
jgi:hypothetical protein